VWSAYSDRLLDAGKVTAIERALGLKYFSDGDPFPVNVTMPKFKYESAFGLRDTLSSLGMPDAFRDGADFSGMTDVRGIYIDNVIHKAYISVDEKGTEAAAATATVMIVGDSGRPRPEPVQFTIDRPFIYLIRDNQTGTILFVGRVLNPGM